MTILGTYDDRLLRPLDRLRATLGDTQDGAWLLSDAYLEAVLALATGDLDRAAVTAAQHLVSQYAAHPTRMTADGVTVEYGNRLAGWNAVITAAQARQSQAVGMWSTVPARYQPPGTVEELSR